jgi:hypothetical protein
VINDQSIGGIRSRLRRDALLVDATQAGTGERGKPPTPAVSLRASCDLPRHPCPRVRLVFPRCGPAKWGQAIVRLQAEEDGALETPTGCRLRRAGDVFGAGNGNLDGLTSSLTLNELVSQGSDRW